MRARQGPAWAIGPSRKVGEEAAGAADRGRSRETLSASGAMGCRAGVCAEGGGYLVGGCPRSPAIKRPAPKPPPQPVVTLPPPKPPVTFPRLRLEGLVVNQGRSAAIINGRVLWIGERIGNVRLVAVDTVSATVELDGQTNVLRLPE